MESKARKQWLKVQHELRSGCLVCFRNKTGIWFLRMLFLCNAVRRRRKNREAEDTEGRSINEVTGGHGIQEEKLDLEEKRHPSPRRMRWGDLCLRKSINIHRSAQMASYLLNHIKRGGWLWEHRDWSCVADWGQWLCFTIADLSGLGEAAEQVQRRECVSRPGMEMASGSQKETNHTCKQSKWGEFCEGHISPGVSRLKGN